MVGTDIMDKRQRDYTKYIGLKKDHLTVIDIETIGKRHYFKCLCDCGKTKLYKPFDVFSKRIKSCGHLEGWALREKNEDLKEIQRQMDNPLSTNKSTGIKNISYNKAKHAYDVEVFRKGRRYRKRLKNLDDALEYKKALLEGLKNEI